MKTTLQSDTLLQMSYDKFENDVFIIQVNVNGFHKKVLPMESIVDRIKFLVKTEDNNGVKASKIETRYRFSSQNTHAYEVESEYDFGAKGKMYREDLIYKYCNGFVVVTVYYTPYSSNKVFSFVSSTTMFSSLEKEYKSAEAKLTYKISSIQVSAEKLKTKKGFLVKYCNTDLDIGSQMEVELLPVKDGHAMDAWKKTYEDKLKAQKGITDFDSVFELDYTGEGFNSYSKYKIVESDKVKYQYRDYFFSRDDQYYLATVRMGCTTGGCDSDWVGFCVKILKSTRKL